MTVRRGALPGLAHPGSAGPVVAAALDPGDDGGVPLRLEPVDDLLTGRALGPPGAPVLVAHPRIDATHVGHGPLRLGRLLRGGAPVRGRVGGVGGTGGGERADDQAAGQGSGDAQAGGASGRGQGGSSGLAHQGTSDTLPAPSTSWTDSEG
ncbi:hypothetical protein GCM10027055_00700 [Janibacter alkaliphilus]